MFGCICAYCSTPYGSATWQPPFLCGLCRQLTAFYVTRQPIVRYWDLTWFEVPPPDGFEGAA